MRLLQELHEALWTPAAGARPRALRWLLQAGRIVERLADDIYHGQLNLYAMSLVYTTLLSIVPVLAVSFSVLKGFGVHNQLEPTLLAFLAPLGDKAAEVTAQIIGFVDNIQVGVLGALGLGILIYTVISLMQKVEAAFNYIWNARSERTLSRRFSDYLSVILVGPVLVFTAIGLTGSAMNTDVMQWLAAREPAKTLIMVGSHLIPFLLIVVAFSFIYRLIPYTRVRLRSAVVGAVVAALLWELAGMAFASFIAASTRYTAIYSGFALGILAIIWVYLAWLILLIGCRVAFYYQHPEHLWLRHSALAMSPRHIEALALRIMLHAGMRFRRGEGATAVHELAASTGSPQPMLERVLEMLRAAGLLAPVEGPGEGKDDGKGAAYLPGEPLDRITVADVLSAVRGARPRIVPVAAVDRLVESVMRGFEAPLETELRRQSLQDLLSECDASFQPVQDAAAGN